MESSVSEAETARDGTTPEYLVVSDFAEREGGTRYQLAEFLRATGFINLSHKYVHHCYHLTIFDCYTIFHNLDCSKVN